MIAQEANNVSGMWYGANGCLQIMLFALIAIKIKSKTPGAHTFPEIILTKHGKIAHLTYLAMGLSTNLLVGTCLVLAGSQIVAALTGMNVYAACFLIPIVVGAYVIVGGLRSTFIAVSCLHISNAMNSTDWARIMFILLFFSLRYSRLALWSICPAI